MSTPNDRKTVQVSTDVHAAIYALCSRYNLSADGALARLLDPGTVHVELSRVQRARWDHAADAGGMSVEEFVRARVEAALQYDADPTGLYVIHRQLSEVLRRLPQPPAPPRGQ